MHTTRPGANDRHGRGPGRSPGGSGPSATYVAPALRRRESAPAGFGRRYKRGPTSRPGRCSGRNGSGAHPPRMELLSSAKPAPGFALLVKTRMQRFERFLV